MFVCQYIPNPTNILEAIEPVFRNIVSFEKIRSTGITLCNLRRSEDVPQDLFGIQKSVDAKTIVEKVGDMIRKKFGNAVLKRASSLKSTTKERGNSFPKNN